MIIYYIYAIIFIVFVLLYNADKIYVKLKPWYYKGKKAVKNPRVTRDVSLAAMVNSMFSLISATSALGALGYFILTLISVVGIIVSNDKIND